MSLTENALPRFRNGFKRRHGLAEVVERGVIVVMECDRVNPPHPERAYITLSDSASRHGDRFAQQFLGFRMALHDIEDICVIGGRSECRWMLFAMELQPPGVYVSSNGHGLFKPPEHSIRVRKIALRDENVIT